MGVHGPQLGRRRGHHQLGVDGEKLCDSIESAIVDACRVAVHQIAERAAVVGRKRHGPLTGRSDSRCAHADNMSLACSISEVGGMASTSRSAP